MSEIASSSKSPESTEVKEKKFGLFHKIFVLIRSILLFAAIVLVCTTAYIFKDSLNLSGLYSALNTARTFSLQSGSVISSSEVDISLIKDMRSFLGGLVVLGSDSVAFIDIDGNVRFKTQISFSSPALVLSQNYFIVYDRGGTSLIMFDRNNEILRQDTKTQIFSVSVNNNGYFCEVSGGTGYRSVVSTYNRKGDNLCNWYTSSYYVSSACVSPSGRNFSAVCMSEKDSTFLSSLIIFDIESETPAAQTELGSDYVFDIRYTNSKTLTLVTESDILFYSDSGEPINSYSFDGVFYAFVSEENSPPVIATNKYSANSFELRRFNLDGSVAYKCTLNGTLRYMSKYGKYIVVATDDLVYVLDSSLQQICSPLSSGGTRGVFAVSDKIIAIVNNSYLHFIKL